MKPGAIVYQGSVTDIDCHIKYYSSEYTASELQSELDLEIKTRNRSTVIKKLQALITRRQKEKAQ